MDLLLPVRLKKVSMGFEEYSMNVENEQRSSMDYLKSKEMRWYLQPSLKTKVSSDGMFCPYFGDTIVIPLKYDAVLSKIHRNLYEERGEFFTEPLHSEYLHITLHDLSSSPIYQDVEEKMGNNRVHSEKIFKEIALYLGKNPDQSEILVTSTFPYPCCNISVVLGFLPQSDRDYRILMNVYKLFDKVVYLDYWLRLHMTLAYFRLLDLYQKRAVTLHNTLAHSGQMKASLTLSLWDIAYQKFSNMNHYETEFSLSDYR